MPDPSTTAAIAAVFFLAGAVKGVVGLGLPTVAIALLSLIVAPAQAAALLLVPSLVTNVAQMAGPGLAGLARRLAPMLAGTGLGALAGAFVWSGQGGAVALLTLGGALIAYAAFGLTAPHLHCPPAAERRLAVPVGLATGVLTVGTGVFVLPAVPFLQALDLERDALVRAMGLSFTVSTVALAAGLYGTGALGAEIGGASAAALVPTLAGMWLGIRLRGRIAAQVFRRLLFLGLLAVGLHLAWRGAAG